MKLLRLSVFCLAVCCNICHLFGQTLFQPLRLDSLKTFANTYYVNSQIKQKNGMPYSGTDTSRALINGETLIIWETYQDGFKTELRTFFDNGQPECVFQWRDRKRNGVSKRWYKNGSILFDYLSKDGQILGVMIMYYDTGTPQTILDEENGISMEFGKNGKLSVYAKKIIDTLKCPGYEYPFEETRWRENGQLYSKTIYNCGEQKFIDYYNDSTICAKGTLVNMKLAFVGPFVIYHENGKLKEERQYDNKEPNKKIGTWKYWNEKGHLTKEEFYEDNELKKTKIHIPEKKKLNKAQQ